MLATNRSWNSPVYLACNDQAINDVEVTSTLHKVCADNVLGGIKF